MKTKKMSLANIQGKLNRTEMKSVMAGSESGVSCVCSDGTQVGIANCEYCFTYCNTRGGISCDNGDCTTWPNG